ncbi:hypothetical protein BP00DRAFT_437024 [Aspergillus indologenus CBS 114.80]|uniref:Protein kinase domain-containing protein n=1 Tax=Aspergillus indologenus CBS 114.80 TaxID=1450541 RepID=A0A2V5J762_9EURO|nr:hypothetical protein BP00DRAFT_437024 [Aspergillus indologenus CBS 114.80]
MESLTKEELLALLQQERDRNRHTTFSEYLEACHSNITQPLTIQIDRPLTTKGSITSPTGRICPTFLQPWDFRSAQQPLFDEVYRYFHPVTDESFRVFPPLVVIQDRGQQACARPLASEADLVRHKEAEVENPVKEIIDLLARIPEAQERFSLGEGIMTGKDYFILLDIKAARKLSDTMLRSGLQPMNMLQEIVRSVTIPVDPDEKLQYNAKLLSCAALTQIFDYMIRGSLPLGILSNGGTEVMLWIDEEDPTTLHYYVADPNKDVTPELDHGLGFRYPYTAIGNRLALTLLAHSLPQRPQVWRNNAIKQLSKWEVDFEEVLRLIPESERKQTPPGSTYRAPRYPVNPRSPYLLRSRRLAIDRRNHDQPHRMDPSDLSESDSPTRVPSSPSTGMERRKRQRTSRSIAHRNVFVALVSGSELDPKCPNFQSHRTQSKTSGHPITRLKLIRLASQQLNHDPDNLCLPLWKGGLHGSLFAITLEVYGYTFVGKGTTYNSHYEGDVYHKLKSVQGSAVPVYLGDIYFKQNDYFLETSRVIIHMSLMAHGGIGLPSICGLEKQINDTKAQIRAAGGEHLDVRPSNMLWNAEVQRVMFIDFGRAIINKK